MAKIRIIKKNNEYFILDVGSTNHTFIYGDRIEENYFERCF